MKWPKTGSKTKCILQILKTCYMQEAKGNHYWLFFGTTWIKMRMLGLLKMRSVVWTWSLMMILRMMMILTAWSCSLLASVDCIALDQLDRVFSGFSIFDWDFDQLDRVVSGLPPLVWELDQTGWLLSGLPFVFILSDQAGRVLSGLSKLNLGLVFLSGLAIPFLVSLFLLTFEYCV